MAKHCHSLSVDDPMRSIFDVKSNTTLIRAILPTDFEAGERLEFSPIAPIVKMFSKVRLNSGKLSGGSSSCFEMGCNDPYTFLKRLSLDIDTELKGKTGMIKLLCMGGRVRNTYCLKTLQSIPVAQRMVYTGERPVSKPIRSAKDMLDWAIEWLLEHPISRRFVRTHTILEQAKARVITICMFAKSLVLGFWQHICVSAPWPKQVASGLKDSQHMFNFAMENLDLESLRGLFSVDNSGMFDTRTEEPEYYGFSSDLKDATNA
jgi:hypothetical protein